MRKLVVAVRRLAALTGLIAAVVATGILTVGSRPAVIAQPSSVTAARIVTVSRLASRRRSAPQPQPRPRYPHPPRPPCRLTRKPCHPSEATTTVLTAAPDPAIAGSSVTLTATVTAADKTVPMGTVQFAVAGSHLLGVPIALNASGVAVTTTTFATAGTVALSAVFQPATSAYASSTGRLSLPVNAPAGQTGGTEPISVTIPPSGALTVTVAPGAVNLAVSATGGTLTATGVLTDVTVTDTRNTYPGWAVSGQESAFTGSGPAVGATVPADSLGWVPVAVGPLTGGATLGPAVAPGTSPGGLGDTPAVLAQAAAGSGFGTNTVSADLTLDIPGGTLAGVYAGELTITYLEAGP